LQARKNTANARKVFREAEKRAANDIVGKMVTVAPHGESKPSGRAKIIDAFKTKVVDKEMTFYWVQYEESGQKEVGLEEKYVSF
jgi:hypothetical protein